MDGSKAKSWALLLCCLACFAPIEARGDWRDTVKGLRIGVVGADNPTAAASRMKPFADHVETVLGIGTEIIPFRSLNAIIEAQTGGRIDIAAHSATSFVAARAQCGCLEAVAVPMAEDGATHFYAIAIARKADKVAGLSDLDGRPVALGRPGDTAAYRVPVGYLKREGTLPEGFFESARTFGDHVAALDALMDRRIDAVFTWSSMIGDLAAGYSRGPLRRAVKDGRISMSQIDIAWRSPAIPHGPVTIRSDLPAEFKAELRRLVLALYDENADAYFALEAWFGFGFRQPDMAEFDAFADLLGYRLAADSGDAKASIPLQADPDETGSVGSPALVD